MSKPSKVIPEKVRAFKVPETVFTFTDREPILYALGIGMSRSPLKDTDDFKYTYELNEQFTTFPTFSTTTTSADIFSALMECPGMPKFNPMMLLHGQQKTEIFHPLPTSGSVKNRIKLADIQDKGKGAVLIIQNSAYSIGEQKQILYNRNTMKLYIRGIGGFGDKGILKVQPIPKVTGPFDCKTEYQIRGDQAILYRLSGDRNPLHIDSSMAEMGGFKQPILHGLCFYGYSARAIVEKICKGDPEKLTSIEARFISHVFPGETIEVRMKEIGGGKVYFETWTKERGTNVVKGMAVVKKQQMKPKL